MGRVSQTGLDELFVEYTAEPAADRAGRWRRMLILRLVSLGITVVVLVALFLWQREQVVANPVPYIVVYSLVLLIGIGWAVGTFFGYRRVRRDLTSIPSGLALRVGRSGLELAGQWQAWSDVAAIRSAKGRWPAGPLLEVARTDGSSVATPLEQISVLPATLDTALRAYSAGRQGLDLSSLDI